MEEDKGKRKRQRRRYGNAFTPLYSGKKVEYKKGEFIINDYHSNYSDWMDEFSENSLKMNEEEIKHYKMVLEDFFARFHLGKVLGLQKALIESLFVVIEKTNLEVEITEEVVEAVLNDNRYKESSRQGMVQKGKMNERWKGTYEVLSKYASGNSGIVEGESVTISR